MNRRPQLLALAAAAVLAVAGCGDDDEPAETNATDTAAETTAEDSGGTAPATKPKVTVPEGAPPAGLQIDDLSEGSGATAKTGDTVSVQYVGVAYSTGKQFDASWDQPGAQPFMFTLGGGEVIPGWDQGVAGMKVGGRRRLTIPPDLAYGEEGFPPDIGPNETLVFVIDLVGIQ